MNFLLFPVGSAGDVHPFAAIARGLKARGHGVTVATSGHFSPLFERLGVEMIDIFSAEEYQRLQDNPDLWHPRRGMKTILGGAWMKDAIDRQIRLIRERLIPGQTIVVGGSLALGARIARDALPIRLVTIHLQPIMFMSCERPPRYAGGRIPRWFPAFMTRGLYRVVDRFFVDPVAGPAVNGARAKLGLLPVKSVFTRYIHSPDRLVGLFPRWYVPPPGDWPANLILTDFPLFDEDSIREESPELTQFLDDGDPPVVATFGSAMKHAIGPFHEVAEAIRQLGRRGILLTPHRPQIPDPLQRGVVHFPYVPLSRVLPRSAAIVHHGGIGTASQALRAGCPQLVMPMAHDQYDNAEHLRRLGVAEELTPRRFSARRIVSALRRLTESAEVRTACREVAGRFHPQSGLNTIIDAIESTPMSDSSPSAVTARPLE